MLHRCFVVALVAVAGLAAVVAAPPDKTSKKAPGEEKVLRAGIIGCDTSHVPAFTKLLNTSRNPKLRGVQVTTAYPGGSPDVTASRTRVKRFTATLRDTYNVKIVDSVEELVKEVDVVLLESVDGRPHLKQILPVLRAGKPVFIDKPLAGSLADAIAIFDAAKKHKVPVFTSSSLRFTPGVIGMRNDKRVGKIRGCSAWSPCSLEEHHPDLFWYGVHGVEILYTIMGTGCESVTRVQTKGTELVVGTWSDGRIGTFRGLRDGKNGYGAMVFGDKGIAKTGNYGGYEPLVVEIVKFFKTGVAPVPAAESIEMFAFMEAADESKRRGGRSVRIAEVMAKARKRLP